MLTKIKKNGKNLKIENFEKTKQTNKQTKKKNGLEIWWRVSYPQSLAWIHASFSEKPQFTDSSGYRMDG